MRSRTSALQTDCNHPRANEAFTANLSVEANGTVIQHYSKCVKTGLPIHGSANPTTTRLIVRQRYNVFMLYLFVFIL